ncbi:MAG: hypothetical protein Q9225_007582 [Loekoesia sp. 1 TL-2023]
MPLLYGEGERRAFSRLQLEIINKHPDDSIYAWSNKDLRCSGLLAHSPTDFADSGDIILRDAYTLDAYTPDAYESIRPACSVTNQGLELSLPCLQGRFKEEILNKKHEEFSVPLACSRELSAGRPLALHFQVLAYKIQRNKVPVEMKFECLKETDYVVRIEDEIFIMMRTHLDEIVEYRNPQFHGFQGLWRGFCQVGIGHQRCVFSDQMSAGRTRPFVCELQVQTRWYAPKLLPQALLFKFRIGPGMPPKAAKGNLKPTGLQNPVELNRDSSLLDFHDFLAGLPGLWFYDVYGRDGKVINLVVFSFCNDSRPLCLDVRIGALGLEDHDFRIREKNTHLASCYLGSQPEMRFSMRYDSKSRLWITARQDRDNETIYIIDVDIA